MRSYQGCGWGRLPSPALPTLQHPTSCFSFFSGGPTNSSECSLWEEARRGLGRAPECTGHTTWPGNRHYLKTPQLGRNLQFSHYGGAREYGAGLTQADLAYAMQVGGREASLELPEVGRLPGPWQDSNQRQPGERGSHLDPFKEER